MNEAVKNTLLFVIVGGLILLTGFVQSWNTAILILNMGLISAIMAIGVNLQWGFAGLFNVGVMGFVALGGLAVVLVSTPPTPGAWAAGGGRADAARGCRRFPCGPLSWRHDGSCGGREHLPRRPVRAR